MSALIPQVEKLKEMISAVGEVNPNPPNGREAIVVFEQKIRQSYTVQVGVGSIFSINVRYFELRGKVFDDTFQRFQDKILTIEPKQIKATKGAEYLCAIFPDGLIRKVDEATWAGELNNLQDLIKIVENL